MMQTDFLKNKTAIVTGASGGIGKYLCQKAASYGMKVVLVGRNVEKLRETADLVTASGGIAFLCPGDLSDDSFPEIIVETAQRECGSIDVLINCAGMAQHSSFEEVRPDFFDQVMCANVKAPYFLCQKALPALRESECATIINICSVVAHKGYPQQSVYAASKHALLGFSKSLANEVYKDNIRVHVISPGAVFTDMVAIARPDLSPEGMTLPQDIAEIAGFCLEHRMSAAVIDEIQVHRTNKEPFA